MIFLNIEEVLAIHEYQIELFGGASGLRDQGGLEAAVATPALTFGGELLNKTVPEIAASYLIQLVNNHPFIDGNKRTGAATALVFIEVNGYKFTAKPSDFTDFVLLVAQSKADKTDAVIFFREWAKERP